jgi:hypothetical protein
VYGKPVSLDPQPLTTVRENESLELPGLSAVGAVQVMLLYRMAVGMQHGSIPHCRPMPVMAIDVVMTPKPLTAGGFWARMNEASAEASLVLTVTKGFPN